jgi:multidrug efflux pump subunit AcrB
MKITKFFMKRPTLFWSLMAGIVIAGIISYIQMPKLEDPAVAVKQAVVVVPYPGASAHEVELKVALAMEDAIRTLPDVRKVKTECQNGMAMINVEFQMTVLKKDLEQHFDLLRRKVNDVRSSLPQECYAPIVMDDMMDVYGIFYSFTADGYSYPEMYKYAKKIRRELLSVKGVKRITIYGNRSESIDITLPKEKISRNGIIPTMIPMALQSRLKPVNCGDYEMGDDRIPLRVSDEATDEKDIGNMLINTLDGKQIRLGRRGDRQARLCRTPDQRIFRRRQTRTRHLHLDAGQCHRARRGQGGGRETRRRDDGTACGDADRQDIFPARQGE